MVKLKYVLKLPEMMNFEKEKVALYSYYEFVEYLEKAKAIHHLEGANPILSDYLYFNGMFQVSLPITLVSFIFAYQVIRSNKLSKIKKIVYPIFLLFPTLFLTTTCYLQKATANAKFIQTELLKSEDPELLREYFKFKSQSQFI
jgi:hypothetical protein